MENSENHFLDHKKYIERSKKREQLKTMPGWKVHWACSNYVSCFEIFRGNSSELLCFLQNPPLFSFQFLPDMQARKQKIRKRSIKHTPNLLIKKARHMR